MCGDLQVSQMIMNERGEGKNFISSDSQDSEAPVEEGGDATDVIINTTGDKYTGILNILEFLKT